MPSQIFELRIDLDETRPTVTRTIQVEGKIHFGMLHQIIQIVMGWKDCHLHRFEIDGKVYEPKDPEMEVNSLVESKFSVENIFQSGVKSVVYTYDFGDDWIHTISLVKVLPQDITIRYPRCISGKMACPPEDSGGVEGYNLIRNSPDDDRVIHWLGKPFDTLAFDLNSVNRILMKRFR